MPWLRARRTRRHSRPLPAGCCGRAASACSGAWPADSPTTCALVLLGIAVIFILPGPFFWGWDHDGGWWWGFAGPFWLALLVVAGVLAYRALSGRPLNLFGRGERDEGTTGGTRATGA